MYHVHFSLIYPWIREQISNSCNNFDIIGVFVNEKSAIDLFFLFMYPEVYRSMAFRDFVKSSNCFYHIYYQ